MQTEMECNRCHRKQIEQRNAWRGSTTTRHAQVAEWGGGGEENETGSREQAAAAEMKCTAARHMNSSSMHEVTMQTRAQINCAKRHEKESMQRTWNEKHVPSFSTPAGLRPNTNVGLHIPSSTLFFTLVLWIGGREPKVYNSQLRNSKCLFPK